MSPINIVLARRAFVLVLKACHDGKNRMDLSACAADRDEITFLIRLVEYRRIPPNTRSFAQEHLLRDRNTSKLRMVPCCRRA